MIERLTHVRANGIKTGYWSPATKEVLVQRLAAYEDTGRAPDELFAPVWISPRDRLPKAGVRVIIARVYEPGAPMRVEQAIYTGTDWWKIFGANLRTSSVAWWMPMPTPPEEVEE